MFMGEKQMQFIAHILIQNAERTLAGLDCSGMVYQGALKSGINIADGNAATQADVSNWEKWLKSTKYSNITVEKKDINTWNDEDWKTGDIIIFDNASHIGTICIMNNGKIAIIHSQGGPKLTCDENKSPKRGPKVMTSDDGSWSYFVNKKISRLRFKLKNSYTLSMRCSGMSNYLYTTNLSIDITKEETFQDEVVFKDYDGSINHQKFTITYDKTNKEFVFVSQMTDNEIPGGVRTDNFRIPSSSLDQPVGASVSFTGSMYGCSAEFLFNEGFKYNSDVNLKSKGVFTDKNGCSISFSKRGSE